VHFADALVILKAAFTAAFLLSAAGLTGFVLLPSRWRSHDPVAALAQSFSLGLSLPTLLFWLAGSLGSTRALFFCAVLLVLGTAPGIPGWIRLLRLALRRLGSQLRGPGRFLLLLPAVASLPALLLPIIDSDGLRYHLALPKLFLLTGKIFLYPWDSTGAYPQSAETLYLLAMRLGPAEAAKWLHFGVFCLGVTALIYFVGDRLGGLAAGWSYAVAPVVLAGASAAFVDGFVVLHIMTALLLLRRRSSPWAVGLALAGAAWTKYSAVPAIAGLVVYALLSLPRKKLLRNLVALCLPSLLMLTPLALRNVLETGDPFYPVLGSLNGVEHPEIDPIVGRIVAHRHRENPGPLGIPWGFPGAGAEPDEIVGWHFLPALLIWPLFWRDRRAHLASALILPYLLAGFWIEPSMRLALPFLLGLAVIIGLAIEAVLRRAGRKTAVCLMALLILATLPLLRIDRLPAGKVILPYLRGEISREEIIERLVPGARAARWVNEQPDAGKVLAMDFPAPFLFDRPWICEGLYNRPVLSIWLDTCPSVKNLEAKLTAESVRFIVVTPGYGGGGFQSLLPLASKPEEEKVLVELRAALRLRHRRDGVDVWEVPVTNVGTGRR